MRTFLFLLFIFVGFVSSSVDFKFTKDQNFVEVQIDDNPYIFIEKNGQGRQYRKNLSFMYESSEFRSKSPLTTHGMTNMPLEYWIDTCGLAGLGETVIVACDQFKCPKGFIDRIGFAGFGQILNDCPNFLASFQCFKEANVFVEDECIESSACVFPVKESDYDYASWTTLIEDLRGCDGIRKRLAITASCKCSKLMEGEELPQPGDILPGSSGKLPVPDSSMGSGGGAGEPVPGSLPGGGSKMDGKEKVERDAEIYKWKMKLLASKSPNQMGGSLGGNQSEGIGGSIGGLTTGSIGGLTAGSKKKRKLRKRKLRKLFKRRRRRL